MADHASQIERIRNAQSIEEIQDIARQFSARSVGDGGILYSRPVGDVSSELIAKELSARAGLPIINDTPRAQFLVDADREIDGAARRLFIQQGQDPEMAKQSAISFRYGDPEAVDGPTSLRGSLWGEASHEFASSLHGDIKLVASAANTQRVFGAVELPAAANNPNVTSLAGMPRAELAAKLQQLGPDGVIAELQDQFITASPSGLFTLPVGEGERPSRVIASREFGDAMEVDSHRLATASELHFAGLPVAPTGLGQVQPEWEAARANYLSEPMHPGFGRAGTTAGLAGIGALAAAYDAKETGERLGTSYAQDSPAAVRSEATHFTARGIGGFAAGVTPFAAGVSGGPALALAVADGVLLTEAFDRGAQYLDVRRITHQADRDGVDWEFNGKQWIRDDLRADLRDDGVDKAQRQTFAALPDKARELNYQASVEALSQAIGKADPRNPFVQPANDSDSSHLKSRDWTRDADTGQWSRMVADEVDRNDALVWRATPEVAGAVRAAELDREASRTIDRNITEGAAGLAARYQLGHKRNGFDTIGDEPAVVRTALNPNTLEASNGKQYWRDTQGQWSHDGETARGNTALELEATRERLIPALAQHQAQLAETPAWKPPTPEQQDRAMLRQLYVDNGWNPDANPEAFEARYLAVQRTRESSGLLAGTTSLALEQDASGRANLDSPILHTRLGPGKEVVIAATTQPDEIALALNEVQARGRTGDAPKQALPEQAIKQASPEERDAREQAQREANRQGLSPNEAQQAPAAPTRSIGGGKRDDEPRGQDTPRDDAQQKRAGDDHANPSTATPTPAPQSTRAADPRDPDHPDHRLYKQIEAGVARIDASAGRSFDQTSERLAMSTLADAKAAGITSADHIALNTTGKPQQDGSRISGGTLLFVVQGQDPSDPAARRSITDVTQAVERPLEQSQQKLDAVNQQQAQTLAQQQDQPTPDNAGRGPRTL